MEVCIWSNSLHSWKRYQYFFKKGVFKGGGTTFFSVLTRAKCAPLTQTLSYTPDPILHILLYSSHSTLSSIVHILLYIPLIQPYSSYTPVLLLLNPIIHYSCFSSYSTLFFIIVIIIFHRFSMNYSLITCNRVSHLCLKS